MKSRICVALYSIPSGWPVILIYQYWNNLWSIPQGFVEQILLFASFGGIYRLGKDFKWFVSTCSWCDAHDGASIKTNGQTTTNGFSIVIDPRMYHMLQNTYHVLENMCMILYLSHGVGLGFGVWCCLRFEDIRQQYDEVRQQNVATW